MDEKGAFEFIGTSIENITKKFVEDGAANFINAIQIFAVFGVTLYIVLTGYAIKLKAERCNKDITRSRLELGHLTKVLRRNRE